MKKRFFAMFLATAMALSLVSISAANVSVSSTASNLKPIYPQKPLLKSSHFLL